MRERARVGKHYPKRTLFEVHPEPVMLSGRFKPVTQKSEKFKFVIYFNSRIRMGLAGEIAADQTEGSRLRLNPVKGR